jgi:CDP-paratose 2-epimerase
MSIALITGSSGLIGGEAARFFSKRGMDVIGLDNDMRKYFFGEEASTAWNRDLLTKELRNYRHYCTDIRNYDELEALFKIYANEISIIIHTAAQPSHDWAAKEPFTDFSVNAAGTLNLLELTRKYAQDAVFIFTSTNKVYGDTPNRLPFVELEMRWELQSNHPYFEHGIDENMSIDQSMHSLFGASKVAADIMVQEYGRYFGMRTFTFRGGCLTGPSHSGTELHGFLAYLVKCCLTGQNYTVYGYKGKQVRDNIHSYDLVNAFWHVYKDPKPDGQVYNIGGGRFSNCSLLEAKSICESTIGQELQFIYSDENRSGDHVWWISDIGKFMNDYPAWHLTYDVQSIITEIIESYKLRLRMDQ